MPTIYIDNQPYEVAAGQNLLQACMSLGFDLPYFCWHPAMHSVGACRQCAVKAYKDAADTHGSLLMACMTPIRDGLRISISDPEAVAFRASVIEWLMVNHPHDCPVCDEGGECHLQDMTVMTGHCYRRHRFQKRTYRNQDLGPFLTHEMNRCIQCYRCVRFYQDFAGGRDLQVLGWHDRVYFGRSEEGISKKLESEFSGNLVEVCPTGVFTDKTLAKHYNRKWDLQTAPSVCVHCSLGCNTIPAERYGQLRRVHNRFNAEVNGYFLCDRGRYGYEFVNAPDRAREPMRIGAGPLAGARGSQEGAASPVSRNDVLQEIAEVLKTARGIVGIGSPRASLEANFALRAFVGPENFYRGMSTMDDRLTAMAIEILSQTPARVCSLREVESADAVLVLGVDPTNDAPMLDFALRQSVKQAGLTLADELKIDRWNTYAVQQAAQNLRSPLFLATYRQTKLDALAAGTYRAAPQDLARLGFAVAAELGAGSAPEGLSEEMRTLAKEIADALRQAKRPLVTSGVTCGDEAILRSAGQVVAALKAIGAEPSIFLTGSECNSTGLSMLGGGSLDDALNKLQSGQADTVIVLENDLCRRADRKKIETALSAAKSVIVLDYGTPAFFTPNPWPRTPNLFFVPSATFAESTGTLVNNEGRAQRHFAVFPPAGAVQESWRWLRDIAGENAMGDRDPFAAMARWQTIDDVLAAMASEIPALADVMNAAQPADFRIDGAKIPREPAGYSGRTAMFADRDVREPQPAEDVDSPLAFTMEGADAQPPSPLLGRYWAPGWNSVSALNKFQQEVGGPLRQSDPGVRLIEQQDSPQRSQRATEEKGTVIAPLAFAMREGQLLLVPVRHIFGSEELSARASAIAGLAPKPYVAVNPSDAQAMGFTESRRAQIRVESQELELDVQFDPTLPRGLAALPVGVPGIEFVDLPSWGQLSNGQSGFAKATPDKSSIENRKAND